MGAEEQENQGRPGWLSSYFRGNAQGTQEPIVETEPKDDQHGGLGWGWDALWAVCLGAWARLGACAEWGLDASWRKLSLKHRKSALLIVMAAAVAMRRRFPALVVANLYLLTTCPNKERTFDRAFKEWFSGSYFPQVVATLHQKWRLQAEKSNSRGMLSQSPLAKLLPLRGTPKSPPTLSEAYEVARQFETTVHHFGLFVLVVKRDQDFAIRFAGLMSQWIAVPDELVDVYERARALTCHDRAGKKDDEEEKTEGEKEESSSASEGFTLLPPAPRSLPRAYDDAALDQLLARCDGESVRKQ